MGVYSSVKRFFFGGNTYCDFKSLSNKRDKIIKKESELIGSDMFFKPLSASDWQAIDALKTQLAHNIVSNKLTIKEACEGNYVFDLIRLSWVDAKGSSVITNEEEFNGLSNGDICAEFVNELSRLALEANNFIINSDDLKKK